MFSCQHFSASLRLFSGLTCLCIWPKLKDFNSRGTKTEKEVTIKESIMGEMLCRYKLRKHLRGGFVMTS